MVKSKRKIDEENLKGVRRQGQQWLCLLNPLTSDICY